MAFLIADRCCETTTTTGTGTLTLAGAVTGYQTLAAVGNANTCTYCVYEVDANGVPSGAWETGIGTYTSAGMTLSRGLIESSTGSLISFAAGTKRVIVTSVAKYSPLAMTTTANRAIQVADQVALGSTSGNARGQGSVDLQIKRGSATQVASSDFSGILNGKNNRVAGAYGTICGGRGNVISPNGGCFVGGGIYNTASESYSMVGGGSYNTASGYLSGILSGTRGVSTLFCQQVHAAGRFSANGDAQRSVCVARKQTTNNTATTLFLDGSFSTIDIPNNTTWTVFGLITARRADADGTNSHWYFMAGIRRDANAASTAMTAACTPVLIGQDAGAALTAFTVDADTTAGALRLNVTGETGKTYNFVGTIYVCESGG